MILRNSATSIIRTPIKTALFVLLITALSAFLYLGINTWASSLNMLQACDQTYTTIAVIEYIGASYPDESVSDADMAADVEAIDFEAIAANENVKRWDPTDCSIGLIDGFLAHSSLVPYRAYTVLTVSGIRELQGTGVYYGTVVESLYCYRQKMAGKHVYIYADGVDFVPDEAATYVLHGWIDDLNVPVSSVHLSGFYSRAATLSGVDCESVAPWRLLDTPDQVYELDGGVYASIADFYAVMNNRIYLYRTSALAEREEFHQGWVAPVDGRLFTDEEQRQGAKVCVITETIASNCNLTVGAEINIRSIGEGGQPAADCYWGRDSLTESDSYRIVGIVNYYDSFQYNVYIPAAKKLTVPQRYVYILGQATLKNGTADAFKAAVLPLLPERATLSIYDQGYQATADSLFVLQSASVSLTVAAAAAALIILASFAHLFVEKQRSAVETMRCFGMRKRDVGCYLLFGAALIAALACAIGVLVGAQFGTALILKTYGFVSDLQTVDLRYSNGYSGLIKAFHPAADSSPLLAVAVSAGVFLLALGLCLYASRRTIEGRILKKRARTQNLRPPKHSSVIGGGPVRYSLLSIRRGSIRSWVVPVSAAVMLLFMLTLLATNASYQQAEEQLYDATVIHGNFVTMRGKYSGNLVIDRKNAQRFIDTGYVDNVTVSYQKKYGYLGIVSHADGSVGNVGDVPWPDNSFTLQRTMDRLYASPPIVFTNNVAEAPEFHFSELSVTYMHGHGAADFADSDWTELPCMLSTRFMESNGLAFGDTIRVFVLNGLQYSTEGMLFSSPDGQPPPPFAGLEMRVIGSFYSQSAEDTIYCPLPGRGLDLNGLEPGEEEKWDRYYSYDGNFMYVSEPASHDMQDTVSTLLIGKNVSSMSFTLKDTRQLAAFKDSLEDIGYSGPNQPRDIRIALILHDVEFMNAMSDIAQRSRYMEILYPVLLALSCAVGLIMASLMQNARREEIATMRGMGVRKGRIFVTFFFEQLILLLMGGVLGASVWFIIAGHALLMNPAPYLYLVSYALGCALTLTTQISRKALAVLSEKE